MFGSSLPWRITHKQPRFVIFDGRVIVLLLLMVMHVRVWTVVLALTAMAVLWFFERKQVSADSILRYLRAKLVGKKRSARGFHAERMAVDFGWETQGMVDVKIRQELAMAKRHSDAQNKPAKTGGKK